MDASLAWLFQIIAQILPAGLNFVFSAGHLNRSLMVDAIRVSSNQSLCKDFATMDNHKSPNSKSPNGDENPFPCFRPGLAAMVVCQAAIAIALTLGVSTIVAPTDVVRVAELGVSLLVLVLLIVFLTSFKNELFRLEDLLPGSRYGWAQWVGRHLGLTVGLVVFIFSLIMALVPLVQTTPAPSGTPCKG